ncbi:uncharacterized protein LOC110990390 [Acanthaster planci]|uniref:Uncharacterized protein LOC110990390 n=1 Tax=Acanthaster planci TaxID=133434 RepID=A0A8B7ZZY5_ACAPL|nr:uncharacterized protein LOC110990390 [Acanthaster planci]
MSNYGQNMENEDILPELLADSDSDMSSFDSSDASGMGDGEDDFSAAAKPHYRRGWSKAGPSWRKHGKTAPEFTGHTEATHSEEWIDFTPVQIFQLFFLQVVWELLVSREEWRCRTCAQEHPLYARRCTALSRQNYKAQLCCLQYQSSEKANPHDL